MKWSRRSPRSTMLSLALALIVVGTAGAQASQGVVRGAVRDSQGVIPGAEVILINDDTNAERTAMTNEVGEYAFSNVLPGLYTVHVSLAGFRAEERKGVCVSTQQSLVFDFMVEIGESSQQITVTDDALLLEGASATQSTMLHQATLQNRLSGASQLSHGGGPRRGNGHLLHAVSIAGLTKRPTGMLSMESVEELKVPTKTYEADMGHSPSRVCNTITR